LGAAARPDLDPRARPDALPEAVEPVPQSDMAIAEGFLGIAGEILGEPVAPGRPGPDRDRGLPFGEEADHPVLDGDQGRGDHQRPSSYVRRASSSAIRTRRLSIALSIEEKGRIEESSPVSPSSRTPIESPVSR